MPNFLSFDEGFSVVQLHAKLRKYIAGSYHFKKRNQRFQVLHIFRKSDMILA